MLRERISGGRWAAWCCLSLGRRHKQEVNICYNMYTTSRCMMRGKTFSTRQSHVRNSQ